MAAKSFTSNMDTSTIYNNIQGIVTFSKWIRILPVVKVQVSTSPKSETPHDTPKDTQSCSCEIKAKPKPSCYLKYSKTQFRLNSAVLMVLVASKQVHISFDL